MFFVFQIAHASLEVFVSTYRMPLGSANIESPPSVKRSAKHSSLFVKHVICNDVSLQAICVMGKGFVEKVMTDPLYKRKINTHKTFLKNVNPVKQVFYLHDCEGNEVKNDSGYTHKMLIFGADGECYGKDEVTNFIQNVLIPQINSLGAMKKGTEPTYDPSTDYTTEDTWTDVLNMEQIKDLFNAQYVPEESNFKDFIHDQDRVYSIWREDRLTIEVMDEYGLTARLLQGNDKDLYLMNMEAKKARNTGNEDGNKENEAGKPGNEDGNTQKEAEKTGNEDGNTQNEAGNPGNGNTQNEAGNPGNGTSGTAANSNSNDTPSRTATGSESNNGNKETSSPSDRSGSGTKGIPITPGQS